MPHHAPRLLSPALAIGPMLLLVLGACQMESSEVSPVDRSTQLELSGGRRVELTMGAGVAEADLRSLATHAEQLGSVAACRVKVKKDGSGATTMVLDLWGEDLPEAEALESELRSEFDFLADATIQVAALDEIPAMDDDGDPEEARQKIVERLRADGVDGDIDVQVHDDEAGRQVEVRVTKDCGPSDECDEG